MLITPGTVRSKLRPELSRMIEDFGIKWVESDVLYKYTGEFLPNRANGAYFPHNDVMCIRELSHQRSVNHTFLHELAHWTGARSRLNRSTVRKISTGKWVDDAELHTEEAVAELAAKELIDYFQLSSDNGYCERYLALYELADLEYATLEAKKVVQYVIARLNALQAVN